MSFLRVAAIRSSPSAIFSQSAVRAVRRTTSQPCLRIGSQTGRRGYASATETIKKTSDLPWAATAVVVTAVGTYIALSPSDAGHGHDSHHGDHGKGHDEHKEKEEPKEEKEESKDEPEASEESTEDKKDDEKPAEEDKSEAKSDKEEESKDDSKSEGESKDDTNASEDAGTEGDSQKGATKNKEDIKHREEDSGKGATKVRMDSPAGKTIGEGSSSGEGDEQNKKQAGVSNTDTKHSTDPNADPGKSSKGEGTAETAKIKGTVQADRPQV